MNKASLTVGLLIITSVFLVTLTILPGDVRAATRYVGGGGPGNYTTIQEAIDVADPGDTVYVYNGTYYENLEVYKTLSLIGEDRNTTIVDGGGSGDVVLVTADWVNITRFTVTSSGSDGSGAGIRLFSAENCYIANNSVSNNDGSAGIGINFAENCYIANNSVSNNGYGITLFLSINNIIANNTISLNDRNGISLFASESITISNNVMVEGGVYIEGHGLEHWNTHTIDTSNTVNGKPVYYWKNVTSGIIPSGAGQVILVNCTGVIVENQNVSNGSVGIELLLSSDITIANNTVSNNHFGIFLYVSSSNDVSNNTISNNWEGIYLGVSGSNTIADNTVSYNERGIYLESSVRHTITNNTVSNNVEGIHIIASSNYNIIDNNNASSNRENGILLSSSRNNIVDNNSFLNNWYGISLRFSSSSDNRITNNTVSSNNGYGIYLYHSRNNLIRSNMVSSNRWYGIILESSSSNMIDNCTASSSNIYGIFLRSSSNNVISNNSVSTNTDGGISLGSSNSNTIANNIISHNGNGISLYSSTNNTLLSNKMVGDGIYIDGYLEHWNTHTIDTSNTVNGKPVYYWKDYAGGTVPLGAGQIILANCTDVIIENQNVTNGSAGIQVGYSSNNTISNNTNLGSIFLFSSMNNIISSNKGSGVYLEASRNNTIASNSASDTGGIGLVFSNNNTVTNNNASNNFYGIFLGNSNNNTVTNNNASFNNCDGIALLFSNDNTIANNTLSQNNLRGIFNNGSHDNLIHHNNFIDNTKQAYDPSYTNQWDNGYPSGGNYWSDYTGVDECSGPNQDVCPDPDGIGDSPYIIDADSKDRYPLMSPSGMVHPKPPTMLQAALSGKNLENITLTWFLSPDDGTGLKLIVGYDVYRNLTYDSKGLDYQLIASLPNGTTTFVDNYTGEGDPNNYFYRVCAIDLYGNTTCAKNQAGKFTRPLSPGPNLVSIPLIQSEESIETVLQTVEYDKAWYYDSSSQEWKWHMTFKEYRRGLWNVNHTMGLWVNVTGDCSLTVAGIVPAQSTIHLHKGWNLIGFPSLNTSYTVADMKAEVGGTRVEGFESMPVFPPYYLRVLGDAEAIQTGYGYWVRVESDTTWTVEVS